MILQPSLEEPILARTLLNEREYTPELISIADGMMRFLHTKDVLTFDNATHPNLTGLASEYVLKYSSITEKYIEPDLDLEIFRYDHSTSGLTFYVTRTKDHSLISLWIREVDYATLLPLSSNVN